MEGVKPRSSPMLLKRVILNSIPIFSTRGTMSAEDGNDMGSTLQGETSGCCPYLQIFKGGKLVFTTTWKDAEKGTGVQWAQESDGSVSFPIDCLLQGDVLVRCRHLTDSG